MGDGNGNGKKIAVILGGGTSGPPISGVFCDLPTWHTVSIAPGSDSGGNSGELRDQHGILPPGDVRRFIIAHAKDEKQEDLRELFAFRYPYDGSKFAGEVGGNVFALFCEKKWGRAGVRRFTRLLNVRGEVHYASLQDTHVVVQLSDGEILKGEGLIDTRSQDDERTIDREWLEPEPIINPAFVETVGKADVIVLAPGDLYTSLLPILLVNFMTETLNNSKAKIVLVLSLMTKKAETHGYTAADFVEKLFEYGLKRIDWVLRNNQPIPNRLKRLYREKDKSAPVKYSEHIRERILARGVQVIEGNYLNEEALKKRLLRHDPHLVVKDILALLDH